MAKKGYVVDVSSAHLRKLADRIKGNAKALPAIINHLLDYESAAIMEGLASNIMFGRHGGKTHRVEILNKTRTGFNPEIGHHPDDNDDYAEAKLAFAIENWNMDVEQIYDAAAHIHKLSGMIMSHIKTVDLEESEENTDGKKEEV